MVIPDASINCRVKSKRGNTFIDSPRFVNVTNKNRIYGYHIAECLRKPINDVNGMLKETCNERIEINRSGQ